MRSSASWISLKRSASSTCQPRESPRDDVAPRRADTGAPIFVPGRVGPQAPRIGLDRGDDFVRRMRCQLFDESGNDPPPLILRLAEGSEDRIVHIEQDGARQALHSVDLATEAVGDLLGGSSV